MATFLSALFSALIWLILSSLFLRKRHPELESYIPLGTIVCFIGHLFIPHDTVSVALILDSISTGLTMLVLINFKSFFAHKRKNEDKKDGPADSNPRS